MTTVLDFDVATKAPASAPTGSRYTLTRERDPVTDTSDAEGIPQPGTADLLEVCGSLSALTGQQRHAAEHYGEHIEAAARFAIGTDVAHTDRLTLDPTLNPCAPGELTGTWIVAAVVPRRAFLRVLLRRENHP